MNNKSSTANSKDWEKTSKNFKIRAYNQGDLSTSCMEVESYKVGLENRFDKINEIIQMKLVKK